MTLSQGYNPVTCPKCSSPLTPGMKFCESCGAKIEVLSRCSQCGAPTSEGTKFWKSCRASLEGTMEAEPSRVLLAVPEQAPGNIQDTTKPQQPPHSLNVNDPKKPLPTRTLAIIGIIIIIVLALGV